jgi:hypothetical protein
MLTLLCEESVFPNTSFLLCSSTLPTTYKSKSEVVLEPIIDPTKGSGIVSQASLSSSMASLHICSAKLEGFPMEEVNAIWLENLLGGIFALTERLTNGRSQCNMVGKSL